MNNSSSATDSARSRTLPLWRCPKCSRQFANRNQEHSCGKYTVEDFLMGKGPEAESLYRAFEKLVLGLGPVLLAPAKTRVGFQASMIFAAVHHFLIETVDQLDDEVLAWLQEAYRVGLQQHLRRVS